MPDLKPFYFLHVPRSGGTAIFANISKVYGLPTYPHSSGNPILPSGDWLPFWEWTVDQQASLCKGSRYICNERMLGKHFDSNVFHYVISVRDPLYQRMSLISYALSEFHGCKDPKNIDNNLLEKVTLDSFARFPNNILTWMLAAEAYNEKVTENSLELARNRLSQFSILKLSSIAQDFKSIFEHTFDPEIGRHSSRFSLKISDLSKGLRDRVYSSIDLDTKLLQSLNITF